MVLHRLLQLLFRHPTVGPQLIQRLSETRPIRSAARLTAYVYLRVKHLWQEKSQAVSSDRFLQTFQQELRKGLEDLQKKPTSGPGQPPGSAKK